MRYLAILVFLFVGSATAIAAGISSAYSDLNLEKCKALELYKGGDEGEGGIWECKGIKGFDGNDEKNRRGNEQTLAVHAVYNPREREKLSLSLITWPFGFFERGVVFFGAGMKHGLAVFAASEGGRRDLHLRF